MSGYNRARRITGEPDESLELDDENFGGMRDHFEVSGNYRRVDVNGDLVAQIT